MTRDQIVKYQAESVKRANLPPVVLPTVQN